MQAEREVRPAILARTKGTRLTFIMLGKSVLNGPILSEHDISGVSVYAAGLDEARALAEADPKVKAGYLTVEAIPWVAVPADLYHALEDAS